MFHLEINENTAMYTFLFQPVHSGNISIYIFIYIYIYVCIYIWHELTVGSILGG